MRKVLFKKWIPKKIITEDCLTKVDPETNKWEDDFNNMGTFHQWGTQSQDNGETMTMDTVAIVELSDGTIIQVYPFNIKFIN